MESKRINEREWLVRLERGELLVENLKKWMEAESIEGGVFVGIGATDQVEVAHYDVESKKYSSVKFEEALEVTNVTGNVGWFEGERLVHAHICLAKKTMEMVGGHLVEATVSGILEIHFREFGRVEKKVDEVTGLKVFSLK